MEELPKLGYEGSMKYRTIAPETKMAAVLEGLRGESTVADICRKYQIRENLYYRWRDAFLEGGRGALTDKRGRSVEQHHKARIEELERVIGRQTVEIEI